jgi:flagellar biosynthetic protein FlhB
VAENEERSGEDLTEEASQHRLEEYRRKGQVAQSKELTSLLALLAAAVTTYMMAPKMGMQMAEFMREVFKSDFSSKVDLSSGDAARSVLMKALHIIAGIGLPICLAGFVFGIIGSIAQIRNIFSFDPLTPDLNKINPLQGLQRLISKRSALDGLRLIIKTVVAVFVAYSLVKSEVLSSPAQLANEPSMLFSAYGHSAKIVFFALFGVLTFFAVIDFGFQKWEYNKNLRMTKQEAKQEHKEREGDPQVKARIRAVQREVARRRMMQAVKKADVIVTNPTHIAIAIVYEKDKMAAPKVVAKGADLMAQRIKKIAADAGIPLVENVPLARTLFKTVKINQYVPRALYQAVAEVLAYVYRLKRREF